MPSAKTGPLQRYILEFVVVTLGQKACLLALASDLLDQHVVPEVWKSA